jgi:hypothetical protein
MKKECEARLRALLPAEEPVLAVGTATELLSLGPEVGSGGGGTFVVVTPVRLLFAPWASPHEAPEEIRFDEVTRWASGTQYNCKAVVLTHPPLKRRHRVPAHRFLWFRWGDAETEVTRTETILRFSRPDTRVAKAVASSLSLRSIVHEQLRFEERARDVRTRGSQTRLYARER